MTRHKNGHPGPPTDLLGDALPEQATGLTPEDVVTLYHEHLGDTLPRVLKLTPTRRKTIRARLLDLETREGWEGYFARVRENRFLTGHNPRNWRANFDFLIRESAMLNILEGKFRG